MIFRYFNISILKICMYLWIHMAFGMSSYRHFYEVYLKVLPVFDQIKHQQIRWILALLCLEITKQNVTICLRRQ